MASGVITAKKEVIFTGTLTSGQTATLSQPYNKYSRLLLVFSVGGSANNIMEDIIDTANIDANKIYLFDRTALVNASAYYNNHAEISFPTVNSVSYVRGYTSVYGSLPTLLRIIGIN